MGLKLEKNGMLFMHHLFAGGVYVPPYIIRTQVEIFKSLSHTPGTHMCLPVTQFSKGMLALDKDDSRFLWGGLCGGSRTIQGGPISEKDQHGHHNVACPRDEAHG